MTRARGGDATAETRAKDVDDDPSTAARDGRGWTLARAIRVVAVTCVVALALDRRAPARGAREGSRRSKSRERRDARALESDGARPTGSHAEVAAFAYLENAVESVRASVEGAEGVVVERARVDEPDDGGTGRRRTRTRRTSAFACETRALEQRGGKKSRWS